MRACKNKTAERWEHAHTCLPPEMLGNTSDPDNVHKTRQWNLSLLTTVSICLGLLWGQDDRLVHKKVWGLRTSVWSLLWLVPSVLCPRYLLCLHLSLSHTHTDTLTHTSIHSSMLICFFFFHISISSLPATSWCNLLSSLRLGASVCLCKMSLTAGTNCAHSSSQKRTRPLRRKGGECRISLIFQLHREGDDWSFWRRSNSQIISMAVRLSKSEGRSYAVRQNQRSPAVLQRTDTEHVYMTREIFTRNTSTLGRIRFLLTAVCMSHCAFHAITRILSNTFLKSDNNQLHIGPD